MTKRMCRSRCTSRYPRKWYLSNYFISGCYSLQNITIPSGITSIGNRVFEKAYSLQNIIIPSSVTSIGATVFTNIYSLAIVDFSNHTSIPTLTSGFTNIQSDCKIIVPDTLYNDWIAASVWSNYASNIISKSDWDALNS